MSVFELWKWKTLEFVPFFLQNSKFWYFNTKKGNFQDDRLIIRSLKVAVYISYSILQHKVHAYIRKELRLIQLEYGNRKAAWYRINFFNIKSSLQPWYLIFLQHFTLSSGQKKKEIQRN